MTDSAGGLVCTGRIENALPSNDLTVPLLLRVYSLPRMDVSRTTA
jgi:hypothetical protein